MTGYGSGEAPIGDYGRLVVEVRAVNHRFFDARLRFAAPLSEQGVVAEEVVRRKLERGRVEVSGRLEGLAGQPHLDRERARGAFEELSALRDELRPGEPLPMSLLSTVPDLFTTTAPADETTLNDAIVSATEQACDAVTQMRRREGDALARDLAQRLQAVQAHVDALQQRVPATLKVHRDKLRERVSQLLADTNIELDSGRLEQEVAWFAERTDVAEELSRMSSHCQQFGELMEHGDGAAVGRRLEFLLQEMARESNTAGSKSGDDQMTRTVVELKGEIERMREQVQNVL